MEFVLTSNSFLVRKMGTNKMQVLHRMQLRQFTPRHALPDVKITPHEWKPDPEVSIKHDEFFARAWECDYERPIFVAEDINAAPRNSLESVVRSDLST